MIIKVALPLIFLAVSAYVLAEVPICSAQNSGVGNDDKFLDGSHVSFGNMPGTFDSLCSYLYAGPGVVIHTTDPSINRTSLHFNFATHPTWRQFFDEIAKQTGSTYKHDPASGYWVFSRTASAGSGASSNQQLLSGTGRERGVPFSLTMSAGWRVQDRGDYFNYTPPTEPVGMDVYMMGNYSTKADSNLKQIREQLALDSARPVKTNASLAEMKDVTVDGATALYFECPTPRAGVFWRQWIVLKNGHALRIVSALPEGNNKLVAEVKSMVASCKIK